MNRSRIRDAVLCGLLAFATVRPAAAQGLRFHGLLDLTMSGRGPGFGLNQQTYGDSPFDPWGIRAFCDGAISPTVSVFTQAVLHDPSSPYVEGAYVVLTPRPGQDVHLMAGRIPCPVGTYAPRSYSDKNPLVGKPLFYQIHSTLKWYAFPASADALLAAAGTGQTGGGMPVVDDSYWDTGAILTGSARPLEAAFGLSTGTPGWGNNGEDENRGKTWLGRVGVMPTAGLRAGVSGAYGPYLVEKLDASLPAGKTANDYHQKLLMADAEWSGGHAELRSEGYLNAWESPVVGELKVHGGYVEGVYTVLPGLGLAARGELMRFSSITGTSGSHPWDHDRDRFEAGLNYRFEREVRAKAVWQRNVEYRPAAPSAAQDLLALQLSVSF